MKVRRTHVRDIETVSFVGGITDGEYLLRVKHGYNCKTDTLKHVVLHLDRYDVRSFAEALNALVKSEQTAVDHMREALCGE